MVMRLIKNFGDYEFAKKLSFKGLVFLMKHSLTCPISAQGYIEFLKFVDSHEELPSFILNIQDAKTVSDRISHESGISHESPQVLVYKNGEVIWNTSHFGISKSKLDLVLEDNS